MSSSTDHLSILARHLNEGDDRIRCAAARAIAVVGGQGAAKALVPALLDEDPDVRCDVMAALVACARPEDAQDIRRSLMGDPVQEIKKFAIQALGALEDSTSIPLLLSLAKDRCAHDVAWEDGAGTWDDWLDVQIAAITALGELGAGEAVKDLLEIRRDEMGQDVDHVVFAALARMPGRGVEALLNLLDSDFPRTRERAVKALSSAAQDALAPLTERLIEDDNPEIRILAIGNVISGSPAAFELSTNDPSASVRQAALTKFASGDRRIATAALSDSDEIARAIALTGLAASTNPVEVSDLATNVQVWLENSDSHLATVCATILPKLIGTGAEDILGRVANDRKRPLEVRIAAIKAMIEARSEQTVPALSNLITDPVQQIRASAVSMLAELALEKQKPYFATATEVLVGAIKGDLLGATLPQHDNEAESESLEDASRFEEPRTDEVRINADGEIVSMEAVGDPSSSSGEANGGNDVLQFPSSTLEAIQSPITDSTLDNKPKQVRRRRVSVDGPDDVNLDIRLIAVQVAAACPDIEIEQAIGATLSGPDKVLRTAAFASLALRSEKLGLSADQSAHIAQCLGDTDPVIRGYASRAVVSSCTNSAELMSALLDDTDTLVRSTALKAVAACDPKLAISGLNDDAFVVRQSAMECVLGTGSVDDIAESVEVCMTRGWSDTLAKASRLDARIRSAIVVALCRNDLTHRQTLTALDAFVEESA